MNVELPDKGHIGWKIPSDEEIVAAGFSDILDYAAVQKREFLAGLSKKDHKAYLKRENELRESLIDPAGGP